MRSRSRTLSIFIFVLVILSVLQAANLATGLGNGSAHPAGVVQANPAASTGVYFDHVVVVMLENHSINNTYGVSVAPNSWNSNSQTCLGDCRYYHSLANRNRLVKEH